MLRRIVDTVVDDPLMRLARKKNDNIPLLSYANQGMPLTQRLAIRSIEQLTGRGPLYKRYRQYRKASAYVQHRQAMWDLAVETLGIHDTSVTVDLPQPRSGKGLLLIANHPYGIADGILLAWIASRISANFRVIAINVLQAEPSLNDNILPINFDENRAAIKQNIATRRAAIKHLQAGEVVAIFPAGGVSWSRAHGQPVEEEPWKPMTGKLINASGCDVLPVYFHGSNSHLYQFVSRHMMSLRQGLYLREVKKKLDTPIRFSVGSVLHNEDLPQLSDEELALWLRPKVKKLSDTR